MKTVVMPDRGELLVGKNRNPFAVIFFSIITVGIYWFVWVYKVNNEIRRHEPFVRVRPGLSVLAQFIPIANLVSDYNLATRIHRMEIADQTANQISPVVTIVLLFFFGIGYVFQIQSHLNAHWDSHQFAARRNAQQLGAAAQQSLPAAVALPQMPAPAANIAMAEPVVLPAVTLPPAQTIEGTAQPPLT